MLIASACPEWTRIGGGTRNFLTSGGYGKGSVSDTASCLFPPGIIRDRDLSRADALDPEQITERIAARTARGRHRSSTGRLETCMPTRGADGDMITKRLQMRSRIGSVASKLGG